MSEILVRDEQRPGTEILEFIDECGGRLAISNSLHYDLSFVVGEGGDANVFRVTSPVSAQLIAERLTEWTGRLGRPPATESTRPRWRPIPRWRCRDAAAGLARCPRQCGQCAAPLLDWIKNRLLRRERVRSPT